MPGSKVKLPKKEEAAAPAAPTAPPLPPPVAEKEEELPPPVAGKEEELPAPVAQTALPLPPPVAGKEQEEELPAPTPARRTIQVTMYDISRDGFLHRFLPKIPPADLAFRTLPADATKAEIQRAAEILLDPFIFGGGGGDHPSYHTTSSDDEGPLTDADFDDYGVGVGVGVDGDGDGGRGGDGDGGRGGDGGPAPTPWQPGDMEFLLEGIVPLHPADQEVYIRKVKRLAGKDLEEEFIAVSNFVQTLTGIPEGERLRFYGLYKVATEGTCTAPQPPVRNLKPHAEWNAWNKLGAMPTEEAMEEYVTTAREFYPSWAYAYATRIKDEEASVSPTGSKEPRPAYKTNELEIAGIHVSARQGAIEEIKKHLAAGVEINTRDSEERTPLHWAVDCGHLDAVEALVNSNADVNAQDNEGQTPLHYAVRRKREDIAELLVKHHADLQIKDGDGNTASDLCSSAWPFLKPAN